MRARPDLSRYEALPLEKDTVITWVLRYNYLGGMFEGDSDSLTITTLFKGK
ncbi:MAG: hypothetical protein IJ912_04875 [Fibrobacter sp.]|nr:hypothetical protein [Fibrobacter sp.]MBR6831973.1 hypothetical protein [Fibrobacter sp.]